MSTQLYSRFEAHEYYSEPLLKKEKVSKREELEDTFDFDNLNDSSSSNRSKEKFDFMEFANYVLAPLSGVFLFGLYVYAEVVRSTGY